MPRQVLPQKDDYEGVVSFLRTIGYRQLTLKEQERDRIALGLKPPRRQDPPGHEDVFTITSSSGHLVGKVVTSHVTEHGRFRRSDAGWVHILLAGNEKPVYTSHPLHRTRFFLARLLALAAAVQYRVVGAPLCPRCRTRIMLPVEQPRKGYAWVCKKHPKPVMEEWDFGLPAEIMAILDVMRSKRKAYRAKLKVQGRQHVLGSARKHRRSWKKVKGKKKKATMTSKKKRPPVYGGGGWF